MPPSLSRIDTGPRPGVPAAEEIVDLDQAFRRFGPAIANVALRILGRPSEAEDVVQDVFLDARRSIDRIRRPGAIRAWLMTATVRLARHRLRLRRLRRFLQLDEAPEYSLVAADAPSPFDRAFMAKVYRTLDEVSVNHRVAWTLRYIEGEELKSVAILCGCSLATAKRWIGQAHARIEEVVDDE